MQMRRERAGGVKFIKQTKLNNCLEACITSLTGIPLQDFPDLAHIASEDANWWKVLNKFLQKKYKIYCETITYSESKNYYDRGIAVAIGDSPNMKNELHAVLWDTEKDEMIFDPSPDNKGLKGKPNSFAILVNYYSVLPRK